MSAKIEIPKSLLVGLVAMAAIAVLGIVFLFGRESGRRHRGDSGTVLSNPALAPTPSPAPAPTNAGTAPGTGTLSPPGPERPQSATPLAFLPVGVANASNDPAHVAVAAYFQAVEGIQPASSGDPESMAQQVVAGLGKGDLSGFDGMIQQAKATRNRLAAITPPQPCAAYHRESLEGLDAGLDLMREIKKDLSSPGQEASAINLAERANALKVRTEALQFQEKSLKQRFGLRK